MSVVRAGIRSTRLEKDKNKLHKIEQEVQGHELDWQALCLVQHNMDPPSCSRVNESMDTWCIREERPVGDQDQSTSEFPEHKKLYISDSANDTRASRWIIQKEKGTNRALNAKA